MVPAGIVMVVALVAIPFGLISQIMSQRHQEKMTGLNESPDKQDAIEARLDRIERAVDTMAVEMERIGEGQRFVTKLLSEQQRPAAVQLPSVRPPKYDTPH
jgi:hypothetical protein